MKKKFGLSIYIKLRDFFCSTVGSIRKGVFVNVHHAVNSKIFSKFWHNVKLVQYQFGPKLTLL
jgi:hypothetical protein